jgi:protein-S-isoprenylcysteine O-methyltransferase Ste14
MSVFKKSNLHIGIVAILTLSILFFAKEPNVYVVIIGACLAAIGEWFRLWGAGHLTKNVALTTSGPYAYIKHPLYVGTFLIMLGFLLAATIRSNGMPVFDQPNVYIAIIAFLCFVFYYFPYKRENEAKRLINMIGKPAEKWVKAVPEFLPYKGRYKDAENKRWSISQAYHNSECFVPLVIAAAFAIIVRDWWLEHIWSNPPDWLMGIF